MCIYFLFILLLLSYESKKVPVFILVLVLVHCFDLLIFTLKVQKENLEKDS